MRTLRHLVALVSLVAVARAVGDDRQRIEWNAAHLNKAGESNAERLGPGEQRLRLAGGWVCVVGATRDNLPLYEARFTRCSKGPAAFEFSVQCEPGRPKDRTQIRFPNANGQTGFVDFIEVSCRTAEE